MGVHIPSGKNQFWWKGAPIVMYKPRDFLPSTVQKQLNRSICCLHCGLGSAQGSMSSLVFARWRQCAFMGGHIGASWRILLNRPSAATMRPCVKLFWPLVILHFLIWLYYVISVTSVCLPIYFKETVKLKMLPFLPLPSCFSSRPVHIPATELSRSVHFSAAIMSTTF